MTLNMQCVGILLALVTVAYGASSKATWCTCGSYTYIRSDWGSGADYQLYVPITSALNGWELRIHFDQPTYGLEIWEAGINWSSEYEYSVGHIDGHQNANLQPGQALEMNFVVQFSGGYPNAVELQLQGQNNQCDCGPGGEPPNPTGDPGDPPVTGPPGSGPHNYAEALKKSILFYEAQRSGWLPDNNRVGFRGHSATNDGWGDAGIDLTGGWYDAGDHVKFGFPMSQTATTLIYGLIEYETAYENAGQLDIMRDSVKWVLDYFIRCHPTADELYFQVGDGEDDHAFWGRPEEMGMFRPSWRLTSWQPGSDCAGETAAAMAAGAIAFSSVDAGYSATLLQHAKELYNFANTYRAKYSDSFPEVIPFYGSTGYGDELAWAAAWLYRATGDNWYLSEAQSHYDSFGLAGTAWAFSWDNKQVGAQMLLYQLTGEAKYGNDVSGFLNSWLPGGGIHYTPEGLAWRDQWGPNRYSGNSAFIACLAADAGLKPDTYRDFAKSQINYMLGSNSRGSYLIGFGKNPANAPHHRSSSCWDAPSTCNWDNYYASGPNPQVLNGALVGGPDKNDWFYNDRQDYIMNEVATDYNAGFQSALAGVSLLYT